MHLDLDGTVVIVTGGTGGIGLATAHELANESARVVAVARREPGESYAASKAAVLSLSKSLAIEYGPAGIRSNVVSPGPTRTALFDAPGGFAEQLA